MRSNLNLPICKLNLAIFLILAFKLYNHNYIITTAILFICGLDIILFFSGIKIKGRDKIKFIQVIALYLILSCATIIITKEGIFVTIFFLVFAIIIAEISVVEYKKIKGRD